MKKEALCFNYLGTDRTKYVLSLLFDPVLPNSEVEKDINTLIEAAADTNQFLEFLAGSDYQKTNNSFVYDKLMRMFRPGQNWHNIRAILGDNITKTSSDAGGLKIGNDQFNLLIPNGAGDGVTRCAVVDNSYMPKLENKLDYFTRIDGCFNIYGYDCGSDPVIILSGSYDVFYYDTFVIFIEK